MVNENYKLVDDIKWKVIGTESMILLPEKGEFYKINDIGTEIISGIHDEKGKQDIIDGICEKYDVDNETASNDFDEFIEGLKKRGVFI